MVLNFTCRAVDDKWIQPLLLIKNYSTSSAAQKSVLFDQLVDTHVYICQHREAGRALSLLSVGDTPCDPGKWDKRQVAIWMESHSVS